MLYTLPLSDRGGQTPLPDSHVKGHQLHEHCTHTQDSDQYRSQHGDLALLGSISPETVSFWVWDLNLSCQANKHPK